MEAVCRRDGAGLSAQSGPPHEVKGDRYPESRDRNGLFFQGDPRQGRVRLAGVVRNPDETPADKDRELNEPIAARLELRDPLQLRIYDAHDPLRRAGREPSGVRIEMEDLLPEVLDARVERLPRLRLARTFRLLAHLLSGCGRDTYGCLANPREVVPPSEKTESKTTMTETA